MERGSYNRCHTGPSPYIKVSRATCVEEYVQSIRTIPTFTLTRLSFLCREKECRGSRHLTTTVQHRLEKPHKQALCPIFLKLCMSISFFLDGIALWELRKPAMCYWCCRWLAAVGAVVHHLAAEEEAVWGTQHHTLSHQGDLARPRTVIGNKRGG
jgi:hypothetical protein